VPHCIVDTFPGEGVPPALRRRARV